MLHNQFHSSLPPLMLLQSPLPLVSPCVNIESMFLTSAWRAIQNLRNVVMKYDINETSV